jgi:hypothetical protein
MVKIWVITQLLTLRSQVAMGTVLEVVGNAKIRQLEEFYDIFNMDEISLEDVESSGSTLSHIVSHIPKQHKLTTNEQIEEVLNGD